MKLYLNFSHGLHFGHFLPKVSLQSNSIAAIEASKKSNKISLKKVKADLNKLSPTHWYDGVWDDLDFKM